MKNEFTIAHLSDLHLSPDYYPERSVQFRSLLSLCRQRQVDHIIITGDLTNQARENEFDHFRSILKEYGLLDSTKVTVVTGNHDIFGGPYFAEDVLTFPSLCRETDYEKRLEQFYEYTRETFATANFFSDNSFFPFLKIIGDIAVVGLNSVAEWHAVKNPLGSNGKITGEQFKNLRELFGSELLKSKHVLVAIHHHFSSNITEDTQSKLGKLWSAVESATLKLRKKKRLLKLFSNANVTSVLHGHVHYHGTYTKNGINFLNAGASIIPAKQSKQAFHFIKINGGRIEMENVDIPVRLKPVHKKAAAARSLTGAFAAAKY